MPEPTHTETPAADAEALATPPEPNTGLVEARDRYRAERDAAREELAAASALVERLRRAEIERVAGESLAMPDDVWLSGNSAADYVAEDGSIDIERVRQDVTILMTERPGLRRPSAAVDRSQGLGGGAESMPKDFSTFFSG